ncbi:MAG TPA: dephospho-CoA kinase [Acidimicrobiia bacterium]|nr:dephospho-CoA kinase [Acidimicrobiia bacterium]
MVTPLLVMGGIGSGKSLFTSRLAELGGDAIDADAVGHLVLTDPVVVAKIQEKWPQAISGGAVDRASLADVIFPSEVELNALESIIHPRVRDRVEAFIAQVSHPVVEVSVPRAISREATRVFVDAPIEVRMQRLFSRGMTREQISARIERQPPRGWMLKCADVVVTNVGEAGLLSLAASKLWTWWVGGGDRPWKKPVKLAENIAEST